MSMSSFSASSLSQKGIAMLFCIVRCRSSGNIVKILQLVCRTFTDNLIGISKAVELLNTDASHALELCAGKNLM